MKNEQNLKSKTLPKKKSEIIGKRQWDLKNVSPYLIHASHQYAKILEAESTESGPGCDTMKRVFCCFCRK